jgi:hypothetical protein
MPVAGFVEQVYFIDKSNPYAINGQFLIKWFVLDVKEAYLKPTGKRHRTLRKQQPKEGETL